MAKDNENKQGIARGLQQMGLYNGGAGQPYIDGLRYDYQRYTNDFGKPLQESLPNSTDIMAWSKGIPLLFSDIKTAVPPEATEVINNAKSYIENSMNATGEYMLQLASNRHGNPIDELIGVKDAVKGTAQNFKSLQTKLISQINDIQTRAKKDAVDRNIAEETNWNALLNEINEGFKKIINNLEQSEFYDKYADGYKQLVQAEFLDSALSDQQIIGSEDTTSKLSQSLRAYQSHSDGVKDILTHVDGKSTMEVKVQNIKNYEQALIVARALLARYGCEKNLFIDSESEDPYSSRYKGYELLRLAIYDLSGGKVQLNNRSKKPGLERPKYYKAISFWDPTEAFIEKQYKKIEARIKKQGESQQSDKAISHQVNSLKSDIKLQNYDIMQGLEKLSGYQYAIAVINKNQAALRQNATDLIVDAEQYRIKADLVRNQLSEEGRNFLQGKEADVKKMEERVKECMRKLSDLGDANPSNAQDIAKLQKEIAFLTNQIGLIELGIDGQSIQQIQETKQILVDVGEAKKYFEQQSQEQQISYSKSQINTEGQQQQQQQDDDNVEQKQVINVGQKQVDKTPEELQAELVVAKNHIKILQKANEIVAKAKLDAFIGRARLTLQRSVQNQNQIVQTNPQAETKLNELSAIQGNEIIKNPNKLNQALAELSKVVNVADIELEILPLREDVLKFSTDIDKDLIDKAAQEKIKQLEQDPNNSAAIDAIQKTMGELNSPDSHQLQAVLLDLDLAGVDVSSAYAICQNNQSLQNQDKKFENDIKALDAIKDKVDSQKQNQSVDQTGIQESNAEANKQQLNQIAEDLDAFKSNQALSGQLQKAELILNNKMQNLEQAIHQVENIDNLSDMIEASKNYRIASEKLKQFEQRHQELQKKPPSDHALPSDIAKYKEQTDELENAINDCKQELAQLKQQKLDLAKADDMAFYAQALKQAYSNRGAYLSQLKILPKSGDLMNFYQSDLVILRIQHELNILTDANYIHSPLSKINEQKITDMQHMIERYEIGLDPRELLAMHDFVNSFEKGDYPKFKTNIDSICNKRLTPRVSVEANIAIGARNVANKFKIINAKHQGNVFSNNPSINLFLENLYAAKYSELKLELAAINPKDLMSLRAMFREPEFQQLHEQAKQIQQYFKYNGINPNDPSTDDNILAMQDILKIDKMPDQVDKKIKDMNLPEKDIESQQKNIKSLLKNLAIYGYKPIVRSAEDIKKEKEGEQLQNYVDQMGAGLGGPQ